MSILAKHAGSTVTGATFDFYDFDPVACEIEISGETTFEFAVEDYTIDFVVFDGSAVELAPGHPMNGAYCLAVDKTSGDLALVTFEKAPVGLSMHLTGLLGCVPPEFCSRLDELKGKAHPFRIELSGQEFLHAIDTLAVVLEFSDVDLYIPSMGDPSVVAHFPTLG